MVIITIIFSIIILALCVTLGALVFWGLGVLTVNVFDIAYQWTFWHGLVCELIFIILGSLFRQNKD